MWIMPKVKDIAGIVVEDVRLSLRLGNIFSTEFSESLAARDASSSKFPKIVENQKIQVCAANAFTEPLVHSLPI